MRIPECLEIFADVFRPLTKPGHKSFAHDLTAIIILICIKTGTGLYKMLYDYYEDFKDFPAHNWLLRMLNDDA